MIGRNHDNDFSDIHGGSVTIRRLTEGDRDALSRLAEVDSKAIELDAPVIGAEVEGTLLAAISLANGESIANPFSRTTEVLSLLELRASQLRRRNGYSSNGRIPLTGRRSKATLASSPPGAGGRLLTLLPRF
jgi:hypothetical protein